MQPNRTKVWRAKTELGAARKELPAAQSGKTDPPGSLMPRVRGTHDGNNTKQQRHGIQTPVCNRGKAELPHLGTHSSLCGKGSAKSENTVNRTGPRRLDCGARQPGHSNTKVEAADRGTAHHAHGVSKKTHVQFVSPGTKDPGIPQNSNPSVTRRLASPVEGDSVRATGPDPGVQMVAATLAAPQNARGAIEASADAGSGGGTPTVRGVTSRFADSRPDKVEYRVCATLSQQSRQLIDGTFQNVKYVDRKVSLTKNEHQTCAAIRQLAEVELYCRIYGVYRQTAGKPVQVLDIGGNPRRGLTLSSLIPGTAYHACCPIVDVDDVFREKDRAGFFPGAKPYCNHLLEECSCVEPDVYMSIDTVYYLDPQEIITRLRRGKMLFGAAHVFPNVEGSYSVPHASCAEGEAKVVQPDILHHMVSLYKHWKTSSSAVIMHVKGNTRSYMHPLFTIDPDGVPGTYSNVGYRLHFRELFRCGTYVGFQAMVIEDKTSIVRVPNITYESNVMKLVVDAIAQSHGKANGKETFETFVARWMIRNQVDHNSLPALRDAAWDQIQRIRGERVTGGYNWRWKLAGLFRTVFPQQTPPPPVGLDEDGADDHFVSVPPSPKPHPRIEPPPGLEDFDPGLVHHGRLEDFILTNPTVEPSESSRTSRTDSYTGGLELDKSPIVRPVAGGWTTAKPKPKVEVPRPTQQITENTFTRNRMFELENLAVKVGILTAGNIDKPDKPSVDWATVIALQGYRAPRPDKTEDAKLVAIQERLAIGVENSEDQPDVDIALSVWNLRAYADLICEIKFQEWLTTRYGRRDDKAKVKAYWKAFEATEAWSDAELRRRCKQLHVQAFIKDETYPGKTAHFKPRLVQNIADLRQVTYIAPATCATADGVKKYCRLDDTILYTAGCTAEELGEWYLKWTEIFGYSIETDVSGFEGCVTEKWVEINRIWYSACGWSERALIQHQAYNRPVFHLGGWKYTRKGGRASGVPDTSLGNSHINASAHLQVLTKLGFKRGKDFVMLVQGDDNYILCSRAVWEATDALIAGLKRLGLSVVTTNRDASNDLEFKLGEFCSSRFVRTGTKCSLVPKIGRLLAKGVCIPHNADTHKYVTPMMEQYLTCSGSSLIRYFAWLWLTHSDCSRNVTYAEPTILEEHLAIYGVTAEAFKEALGKPSGDGTWEIPMGTVINTILQLDCPIDDVPDKVNTTRLPVPLSAPRNPKSKLLPDIVLYRQNKVKTTELEYDPYFLWVDPDIYAWREADI